MLTSQRITWVDWAKVICIWLMVCCHAGQKGMILNLTYQFHMPAFFIVSGMLFHPKGVGQTLKLFLVPILFYSCMNGMFRIVSTAINSSDMGGAFYSWLYSSTIGLVAPDKYSPFQGYWFIFTLLFLRLTFECSYIRKHKMLFALACLLFSIIEPALVLPSTIQLWKPYHLMSCMPFFVIGMLLRDYKFDITRGSFEFKLLLAVIFIILTFIQGRVDLGEYNFGVNYILLYINAIIGSYLLFNICNILPYRNWIKTLSIGTFCILGLHGILYGPILGAFRHIMYFGNMYLPLLVGAMVLAICYPIIVLLNKHCPLLLGKAS